jgi:hypothetical protein
MATFTSYCVRCREMRSFEAEPIALSNGGRAAQGVCKVCGTALTVVLEDQG